MTQDNAELFGIVFVILAVCLLLRVINEVLEAYLVGRRSCQNVDWYAEWLLRVGELEREELLTAKLARQLDAVTIVEVK